ncbi:MAG: acyl-ACP--UDP-N-acetylglucosamine O-acyltransferase [Dokdonella sp.]|nr:acyl-ACP--UDP-N-acetylglucosamine O-acyltransferase [Dokdonella sp.]
MRRGSRVKVHPSAQVDPGARLDDGVEIGAYSVIGADVTIGAGTTIGAHVVIEGPTRIGRDNRIFAFVSLGAAAQDKKFAGERTELVIGDRNTIREFVTCNRGTAGGGGVTRIGHDNWLLAYSHIAHDCQVGDHCVFSNNATLAGHVEVGDHVIVSGFAGVHQFCRIGAHAFIANNAAVTRDVPPYVMAVGQPATPHSVNAEGLKRRGFTPQHIRNIRNAFRILYREDRKLADALERLRDLGAGQPELAPLVAFIEASQRSLVR